MTNPNEAQTIEHLNNPEHEAIGNSTTSAENPTTLLTEKNQHGNYADLNAVPEKAAIAAVDNTGLYLKTDWMYVGGIECRFIKVPAYSYTRARAALRQFMRQNQPKVPRVANGPRMVENPHDPQYQRDMAMWQDEAESIGDETILTTSMLLGVEYKNPIPSTDTWINDVAYLLAKLGISRDDIFKTYLYNNEDMLHLVFTQYVTLADNKDMRRFNAFQAEGVLEIDEHEGVDMF